MIEENFRKILKEALEKKQLGLIIWGSYSVWDRFGFNMKPGNANYDSAISQVLEGKEAIFSTQVGGLVVPGFIAVSVYKLNSSPDFFDYVLNICQKNQYEGPVTFIPSNKLSESL